MSSTISCIIWSKNVTFPLNGFWELNKCSSLLSVAVMKRHTQKQLWERGLAIYSLSREASTGTRGRNQRKPEGTLHTGLIPDLYTRATSTYPEIVSSTVERPSSISIFKKMSHKHEHLIYSVHQFFLLKWL